MSPFLWSLVVLSSALYALSFPPFSWSFLAWVALVPLFIAISQVSPRQAAWYGGVWAILAGYGVAWWCPDMLAGYLGLSMLTSWTAFGGILLLLAAWYYAALAAWLSWLTKKRAVSPLLVAAAWGVCEFARANVLIGNPWAVLGYSQVGQSWLIQIADIAGVYGISMIIVAVNTRIAGIWSPSLRGRRPALSSSAVTIVLCLVIGYGQWRLAQEFGVGNPLRVAIVQGGIERQFRWKSEYRQQNLDRYLALTKEAMVTQPSLLFWPEYAVEFYLQEASPLSKAVFDFVREHNVELILGGPHYSYGVSRHHHHNSLLLIRRGKIVDRYDKLRLIPFAEERWFGVERTDRRPRYEGGRSVQLLHTEKGRIGAFVCFESMYPALARYVTKLGAEILVNPSNDDWFDSAIASQYQLEIAALRAVENRRYLIRPTSTGFSAIIDPHGRFLVVSQFGVPQVLTAAVSPVHVTTLYYWWGDIVCWGAMVLVLLVSIANVRKKQKIIC